jgi:hypothetical protein
MDTIQKLPAGAIARIGSMAAQAAYARYLLVVGQYPEELQITSSFAGRRYKRP